MAPVGVPNWFVRVAPAGPFWQAEEEHQDYLQKIPFGYTCHYVRPDWVLPRREAQTTS